MCNSHHIPVAAHCSLAVRSTAVDWRGAAALNPVGTGCAADCTACYLNKYGGDFVCFSFNFWTTFCDFIGLHKEKRREKLQMKKKKTV